MNVQLLISSGRGPKTVDLSEKKNQLIVAMIGFVAALLLLTSGYLLANYLAPAGSVNGVDKWYTSLLKERQDIKQISEQATNDINALALTGTPAVGGPEDDIAAMSSQLPDLLDRFTELQRQIDDRQNKFLLLESILMDRELREQVMPNGRPVTNGWLSSRYGKRIDPFSGKTSWHAGVDFAGKKGSDVISVASGIVTLAKNKYGFGRLIEISHGNGFVTRYAHNSKLMVKVGDKVEKGEVIAKMGSTGRSTGPHVHFEVLKDNKVVNPRKYILGAKKAR